MLLIVIQKNVLTPLPPSGFSGSTSSSELQRCDPNADIRVQIFLKLQIANAFSYRKKGILRKIKKNMLILFSLVMRISYFHVKKVQISLLRAKFFTEIDPYGSQNIHNFPLISDLKKTFHKNALKKDNLEKLVFQQNPQSLENTVLWV
jgi:hypothetical protein